MRTGAIGLAIVGALLVAAPAVAQTNQIEIFLDQVLRGDPGDVFVVHTESVDPALVGGTCSGTARTENNASEHPSNDLLIASGVDAMTIPDFEAVAGQVTSMTGPVTLGESITVSIRLGGDGISSGGLHIAFSCTPQQPEPTTTTTEPEPTTTVTSPPQPRTTVTTPPTTAPAPPADPEIRAIQAVAEAPIGGVSAGGGSTAAFSVGAAVAALGAALLALAFVVGLLTQHRASARESD